MDESAWRRHRLANRLQSVLLLAFMAAYLALLGELLWGRAGLVALSLSLLPLLFLNPAARPEWLVRLYGARPLHPDETPGLFAANEILAERAGLPAPPRLYLLDSPLVNAFSTGRREDSVVVLSRGLLELLDRRQLVAVLAHEISHIRADDTWVMGIADLFARLTSAFSLVGQMLLLVNLPLVLLHRVPIDWFAIALLVAAPTLSALAQLGLSRTREYDADLNAVRLTGDPEALVSALAKIDRYSGALLEQLLWPGKGLPEPSWLRTHPPTEERIRRIRALEGRDLPPPIGVPSMKFHLPDGRGHRPRWRPGGLWY